MLPLLALCRSGAVKAQFRSDVHAGAPSVVE